MFQNSHFALAVHVLTALSIRDRMTSVELAASVNTHPTFVRTLLGRLKEAGLVDVKMGKGGGAVLARPAKEITLLDVYRASDAAPAACHHSEPNAECIVGRNILGVLDGVMSDVEAAVEQTLAQRTVADVARRVRRRG
ncbi:MAG: Rrf2 family transcriptional regulator [Deltaproteobacteria bacterium]|nr:Rrf2 family transcriptional regulator [Deltaproteobacteria bacterium]